MAYKQCAICGKSITYRFWVCKNCEISYGLVGIPYTNWPLWVKALVKLDRRQLTLNQRETVFSEIEAQGFDPFEYITRH